MKKSMLAMGCLGLLASPGLFAAGDAAKGKDAFETNCSVCHNADSEEQKIGPGLKGLYKRAALVNKKKVTDANVTSLINEGGNGMPGFGDQLTAAEKANIVAYLKTL